MDCGSGNSRYIFPIDRFAADRSHVVRHFLADVGLDFLGRGQGDILATALATAELTVVHHQKAEGRFRNTSGLAIMLNLLK